MKFFVGLSVLLLSTTLCAQALKMTTLFGGNWIAPGIAAGYDTPVGSTTTQKYFRVGGQIADYYQSRTDILDVSASAKIVVPVKSFQDGGIIDVYVQALVGPSVYFNSQVNWGYHFAILPGARYFLDKNWGVFAELGYSFHALMSGVPLNRNIAGGSFSLGVNYEF